MSEPPKAEKPGLPSRLTALMLADMVGYTRLMERDQSRAINAVNALKDTYLEPVVLAHQGQILKRLGDGWIISLSSVVNLVRCAIEIQLSLADHKEIKLRIGAHIGEIYEDEDDFYGSGINLAHRLQTESPPGGLMISSVLCQQLPTELKTVFQDAGRIRLKNIDQPVHVFQWRPAIMVSHGTSGDDSVVDEVPKIIVKSFDFAPPQDNIGALANDLRDQLIARLSMRTGIRVLDGEHQAAERATYILHGRMRIAGEKGRINIKLLGITGGTLFARAYESDTSDIFRFTDDVTERIDTDLRLHISTFDSARIAHLSDDSLSISELRSRAAGLFHEETMESYERAIQLLDKAVNLNPDDAMAITMRAMGIMHLAAARNLNFDQEKINSLLSDLDRAVELEPKSDFIFSVRASFKTRFLRDARSAMADAKKAISLGPSLFTAHTAVAQVHILNGDFELAIPVLEKLCTLSSENRFVSFVWWLLAICHHLLGNQDEAIEAIDISLQQQPRQWCFYLLKALCCKEKGDTEGAIENQKIADELPKKPSMAVACPVLPDQYKEFADLFVPNPDPE